MLRSAARRCSRVAALRLNEYSSRNLPESPYLAAVTGRKPSRVPVWFMRQAGRSLPEYRALRQRHSMLAACFEPELVCEITLQPIRRHDVDAAILFSDIVVPLRAAGVDLDIVADVGPVIAHPVRTNADIDALKPLERQSIQPICEAVSLLVDALGEVPLIGFAGAPFTLASYLVEGGPSRNHARTKAMMLAEPASWHALMSKLTDLTVAFLRGQIDAGVDAIQVFDSWAGTLSLADYRHYVLPHSTRVFAALAEYGVPMTHFGVGTAELLGAMSAALKPATATVVGVDWRTSLTDAAGRVEARHRAAGQPRSGGVAGGLAGGGARRAGGRRRRTPRRRRRSGRPRLQPRPRSAAGDRSRRADRAGVAGPLAMTARSYCVVGGGISGLTAAYRLRAAVGDDATITLFDPGDKLGGMLRTERVAGRPMDLGAEAFVLRRPEMPALLAELGLVGDANWPPPAPGR